MMTDTWKRYAADFNAMSDDEVERAKREFQDLVDGAQDWLEAVASWEAAGKPRSASAGAA